MNTRQLSYIIAIEEHGNLSAASRALGVSQPALSKYLLELEEELGTELFLRHKKKLYPTAAGRIYLEAARKIIAVKSTTYQMIASLSGACQKTITVGVTPLRGAISIAKIFPEFRQRYPNVQIEFKEQYAEGLQKSVIDHSVDLALSTCIELEDPDILHIVAFQEDLILFVPSFHPLAPLANRDLKHLTSIDIRRFLDTPFLTGGKHSTIRKLSDLVFQQNQMQPTIVYEADNNLILKNMVKNGAGVCLLPRSHAEPSENVVYFSLKPNYYTNLTVMVAKDHTLSTEERCLIALNFGSQFGNPNYLYHPTPLAEEILNEFHISDASRPTFH